MTTYKMGRLVMAITVAATGTIALGAHVPAALDVPTLWTPLPGAGYLNFMTPGSKVFPFIGTEEHTGYTTAAGVGVVDPLGPPIYPGGPDNDPFAGDRADFDWVQEHRADEHIIPSISHPPGVRGAVGRGLGTAGPCSEKLKCRAIAWF